MYPINCHKYVMKLTNIVSYACNKKICLNKYDVDFLVNYLFTG